MPTDGYVKMDSKYLGPGTGLLETKISLSHIKECSDCMAMAKLKLYLRTRLFIGILEMSLEITFLTLPEKANKVLKSLCLFENFKFRIKQNRNSVN